MTSLIPSILFAGTALLPQQPPPMPPDPHVPTIVTTGDAVVRRIPDRAFVTIAVESRAKNPRDAQRQNAEAMTGMQQRLTQTKIAKDAIRTVGYGLDQEWDYVPNGRVPRGFVARNTIEVRVDEIGKVGEVIDSVVRGGATSVDNLRFDVQDRAMLDREALRLAVADARGRADAVASGAGLTVEKVLRIEDIRQVVVPPPSPMMMRAMEAAAAPPTPIEPGVVEVRAHVTLTVSIR
jgi:uncharacterized protein YggE